MISTLDIPSPNLEAYATSILENPGAIPTSQSTLAPDCMAFSLYESGVTSLKLKSTTHFPLDINISVALNPRLPGNMLTNISFSLDVLLQYSNASITCTFTESKLSNS